MRKYSTRILIAILTFVLGISAVVGWFYYQESQKVKIELSDAGWEPIFFKEIDKITELGGLKELRKTTLRKEDIEIRVWRSAGNWEGLILKRTYGYWRAFHVKTARYAEPEQVIVKQFNFPKSGWDSFWNSIVNKGILTLRTPLDADKCLYSTLDGTSYFVEINHNMIYRTYGAPSGKCDEGKLLDEIADIIGEEFDTGSEECKTTEWFACTKLRKSYERNSNKNER